MKPIKIDRERLIGAIKCMLNAVERNDSFEGSIEYSCMDPTCNPGEFLTRVAIRVGNSEGQGGTIMLGEPDMPPKLTEEEIREMEGLEKQWNTMCSGGAEMTPEAMNRYADLSATHAIHQPGNKTI